MSKEKPNITLNFYGPVGQQIANIEHQEVHFDKDMKMQVMNVEEQVGIGEEGIEAITPEQLDSMIYPYLISDKEIEKIGICKPEEVKRAYGEAFINNKKGIKHVTFLKNYKIYLNFAGDNLTDIHEKLKTVFPRTVHYNKHNFFDAARKLGFVP